MNRNSVLLTPNLILLTFVIILVCVTFIVYSQAQSLEFYLDDWSIMESLGRLGPMEYAIRSLNPLTPDFLNTYRPFQGIMLAVEYSVLGAVPAGYHLIHIAIHCANSFLLFIIMFNVTKRFDFSALSSLLFASFPLYSLAVFLLSATDVIATFFYLLASYYWLKYLRMPSQRSFITTFAFFILGLLSKEFVVTLPIVLVLLQFIVQRPNTLGELIRRYLGFGIVTLLFVVYEANIYMNTTNFRAYGTGIGSHVFMNTAYYVAKLFAPWNSENSVVLGLGILVVIFGFAVAKSVRPLIVFAALWGLLNILPVVGFQRKVDPRFLYLSGVTSAIWFAAFLAQLFRSSQKWRVGSVGVAGLVVFLLVGNGNGIFLSARDYAADSRAQRAPFRDIVRSYPTLPPDTFLYFINSPISLRDLSGMLYTKYKNNVTTGELLDGIRAPLRAHQNSIIFYFDETRKPIAIKVEKEIIAQPLLPLPVHFEQGIDLIDYDLSSNAISHGDSLALVLYWRASQNLERDYTVFLHLVDADGSMLTGVDGYPVMGKMPTSTWIPGKLIADAIILPIDQEIVSGTKLRLEIGFYFAPTMERLPIVDAQGQTISDHLEISPLTIQ